MKNEVTIANPNMYNESLIIEGDFSRLELFSIDGDGEVKIKLDGAKKFIFIDKEEIIEIIHFLNNQLR